jgi:ABC-type siderophore export system fused ATPase/permease subunit
MNLVVFIPGAPRRLVLLATLAGLVGGAASVGLLALIHAALGGGGPTAWHVAAFVGSCLLTLGCRTPAQALLVRLGQGALYRLSTGVSRRIQGYDAPVGELEA